jgi:hypothetical protein
MRYYMLAVLLLVAGLISALKVEQCTTLDNTVLVKLTDIKVLPDRPDANPNLMVTSQTYALPYQQAQIQVNGMTWKEFDANGNFLRTSDSIEDGHVYLAHSFAFREMRGFTVNILNQVNANNTTRVLQSVDFKISGFTPTDLPQAVSPAFVKSYEKLADNYNTSYLRNLPLSRPGLLIISHASIIDYLANFVAWKKSSGYDVYVVNISTIGSTAIAIRDFVLTHYNQFHCDHLLILGDVTGTYTIPTNIYTSPDGTEHDADDNFYTMLTGDDYFPEMLSGRFSFGDISELLVQLNKTVSYEKTPYMSNTNWMHRALVVAGNYAEGGLRPVTPYQMSMWLREKMLAEGYMQVDTVFYTLENPTLTGASLIQASINQGVQYVSYRGWGAADGWHYPSFHNVDLNSSLINGSRMPAVFSIVCNTGDFANTAQNPCFGEKWMRMGTISSPGGCIAFVGPSDLHTKTNLNNTISSGMFSSILDNWERDFGAVVLAGKVELYRNYPLDLAADGYVSFYYHVYNILSDPSLKLWMLVPQTIPASVITSGSTFSQSASNIRIQAANLNGAIVSGTKNNIDFSYAKVHDGYALLPINPEQAGNLTITINKDDFVPLVATLTPTDNPQVGVISNSLQNTVLNPGQSYQMVLGIKNYTANSLMDTPIYLSATPSELVIITDPPLNTNLLAGMQSILTYNFAISPSAPSGSVINFSFSVPYVGSNAEFELQTGGPLFTVISQWLGGLTIGSATIITFNITNTGTSAIENASVQVQSSTTAASVPTAPIVLGNFAVNQTSQFQVPITVASGCYNGRSIPLQFNVTTPEGYSTYSYCSLTAGNPAPSDPTGPDEYGYFAYDSHDTGFAAHPTYAWTEIDNGNADVHLIVDDDSYTVDLPFTFRYYGHDYDQLTICSNGWASFIPTWMNDFNNLYIPATLGPYAMVAPYWDDLKGTRVVVDTVTTYNNMRICNWYDQTNNRFIVEWNNAYSQYTIELTNPSLEKFQLILYPRSNNDGDIVFQYHTIDNPSLSSNYSTVGIENHLQNSGLLYSYANIYPVSATQLQSGLAIKFTTTPPDNFVANEDEFSLNRPFQLHQNHPNPFNPDTKISFNVNTKQILRLEVYNLKGQLVRTLHQGVLDKGTHELAWDGKDDHGTSVGSGVYLYKLNGAGQTQSRKMIMMK